MKNLFLLFLILFGLQLSAQSDKDKLVEHVRYLSEDCYPRNYQNPKKLDQAAAYIFQEFSKFQKDVSMQNYIVQNSSYKNVIARINPDAKRRLIVGAHYDVCGDQAGADDNATGVAALLELARLLDSNLSFGVDLVAYSLEEPPFFRTQHMGSYVHAQSIKDKSLELIGMISIEMIGYFSDEKNSQEYPLPALSLIYGKTGDYITLVSKLGPGKFVRKFSRIFKKSKLIKTKKFKAPKSLPGIDFSDHLNYWNIGIPALMITDTSFYRNKNYHEKTDTIDSLDFNRMNKVVNAILLSILNLDSYK